MRAVKLTDAERRAMVERASVLGRESPGSADRHEVAARGVDLLRDLSAGRLLRYLSAQHDAAVGLVAAHLIRCEPLPPPFPVGIRLRYVGESRTWTRSADGELVPLKGPGLVVTIEEVKPGYVGTGRQLRDHDGPMYYEDTGEPILDETEDGYSVYYVTVPGEKNRHGRCVHPYCKPEWEVIA